MANFARREDSRAANETVAEKAAGAAVPEGKTKVVAKRGAWPTFLGPVSVVETGRYPVWYPLVFTWYPWYPFNKRKVN